MLAELKEQYKELGKQRTEFSNKVNKVFLALYDELMKECCDVLFDINISTNFLNRFVDVKISLHNLNNLSPQLFEKSKFLEFNNNKVSFYLVDIDTSEVKRNNLLANKQISAIIEMTKFLFNFYFYLNIKNKNIENESIDWLIDEVSRSINKGETNEN